MFFHDRLSVFVEFSLACQRIYFRYFVDCFTTDLLLGDSGRTIEVVCGDTTEQATDGAAKTATPFCAPAALSVVVMRGLVIRAAVVNDINATVGLVVVWVGCRLGCCTGIIAYRRQLLRLIVWEGWLLVLVCAVSTGFWG